MARTITVEVLIPFLEELGISEDQLNAVESNLQDIPASITYENGVAALFHRDRVLAALEGIDDHPWKGENPVEFRWFVQSKVREIGVLYWILGADTLPLE